MNTNFYRLWFDLTGNRTRVYRFSSKCFIRSITDRINPVDSLITKTENFTYSYQVTQTAAYAGFLRRTKIRMKIVSPKISPIFLSKLGEDKKEKKRSSLKFRPIFCPKLGEKPPKKSSQIFSDFLPKIRLRPKTKVFAYHLCAQSFCPTYKEGGHAAILHTTLCYLYCPSDPKGGAMAQCPPPLKYAPGHKLILAE